MPVSRTTQRLKRHTRLRKKVAGTAERPRLQIFRSLHHTYAFVVDDAKGHTLVAASTREGSVADGLGSRTNVEAAQKIGTTIAQRAKAAGIDSVVFDTSGLKYHGRVAALAQAAREAGLEF
ncbi:MAG TPA: 50S ribosomal protein L18 [Candidatus Limnocylindria bacterium]|jgi:large subunit ribosomal protein L18|nr:50S ribosomal protein L18 [Candidatus Limnocylindria bacterium]